MEAVELLPLPAEELLEVEAATAPLSAELLVDEPAVSPPLFGFDEEYRSLYQPPPLNCTAGAEITRSSVPPQAGHVVISGSENFWIFSTCLRHCLHSYS